ncbi:hypothetical protein AVEN_111836-1 [Araneus ventricosus]|uniref:DUF4817 domain-containing protein n=1 Tax=Araneus ventricosus TaxID=182803 RepID=A0A4Y2BWZ0_ARAVE|nr:hypothetical protein AVEN_111836-1 [Araneus ventricosus]
MQRIFLIVYKRNPPDGKSIKKWQKTFLETGTIQKRSRGNQCSLSNVCVEDVQQDFVRSPNGASPNWGTVVRAFLDTTFPNRWIGRGGPIAWPPRSSDVTSLDFFVFGCVKDKVYSREIRDFEDLRASIIAAIAIVIVKCYSGHGWNWATGCISSWLLREPTWKCTDFLIKTL